MLVKCLVSMSMLQRGNCFISLELGIFVEPSPQCCSHGVEYDAIERDITELVLDALVDADTLESIIYFGRQLIPHLHKWEQ